MLETAVALYDGGDFTAAASLLVQLINTAPEQFDAWRYLGLSLFKLALYPQLFSFIELRQKSFADGLILLFGMLDEILRGSEGDKLAVLASFVPANTPLGVIVTFFLGCHAARHGEPDMALRKLLDAAIGAQRCGALFQSDPRLYSIESQGHVFSDFAGVERLERQSRQEIFAAAPSLAPVIKLTQPPLRSDAQLVYLASCNQLYLARFGGGLVEACDRAGIDAVLHIHVVDPTSETAPLLARLAGNRRHIVLRHTEEDFCRDQAGGYRSASYYACARFLRAGEIAAHYGKDLLILDLDIDALGDVAGLVDAVKDVDFAYFNCDDVMPWLLCRAAAVYIKYSPSGAAFMSLLGKYIASKIEREGFWGLDQAALYVASRYLASRNPEFCYRELSPAAGWSLSDFTVSRSTAEEKQLLRGNAVGSDYQPKRIAVA